MPLVRTTDGEEAARLRAAGARLVRHAHDRVLEPAAGESASPDPPGDLRLHGVTDLGSRRIAVASRAAYTPDHPDTGSLAEAEHTYARLLAGEAAGPLIEPASAVVTDGTGGTGGTGDEVVASIIVTRLGPAPWGWAGGPWVADVFVVPGHQGSGLGRLLLTRAIASCEAAGEPRIGLTVTESNPAERLYAALGFRRRRTLFLVDTG
jgi:GNAT superfamily N-acetyltransferase